MATVAPQTLNLMMGQGPYVNRNPKIGPEIDYHGQRVNLTRVPPALAKQMADDKHFLLIQHAPATTPSR